MPPRTATPPGYAEALAAEAAHRSAAWLAQEEPICGVPIAPITLRRLYLLAHSGNPIADELGAASSARPTQPFDIAAALWLLSPDFHYASATADTLGHRLRRARFYRRQRRLPAAPAETALRCRLAELLQDLPAATAPRRGPLAAPKLGWLSALVHRLAAAYGWQIEPILDTPMRQIVQLLRSQAAEDSASYAALENPLTTPILAARLAQANARRP